MNDEYLIIGTNQINTTTAYLQQVVPLTTMHFQTCHTTPRSTDFKTQIAAKPTNIQQYKTLNHHITSR